MRAHLVEDSWFPRPTRSFATPPATLDPHEPALLISPRGKRPAGRHPSSRASTSDMRSPPAWDLLPASVLCWQSSAIPRRSLRRRRRRVHRRPPRSRVRRGGCQAERQAERRCPPDREQRDPRRQTGTLPFEAIHKRAGPCRAVRGHLGDTVQPRLSAAFTFRWSRKKYDCRDPHADERPYEWLTFSEHSKDFEKNRTCSQSNTEGAGPRTNHPG
jgi:hypothetical protein